MSKFQIILLAVFGIAIVAGVMVFSLYRGSSNVGSAVLVWGDISSNDFSTLQNTPAFSADRSISITYEEKSPDTMGSEFTEALARGSGPDLIIITQDHLWVNKPKLAVIPYASISEGDFKTTFVEEGELFLIPTGIYALPLTIDPLVLYYNRDLLSDVGQSRPMAYWDEIYGAAANLSKMDPAGNLVSSVMALGEAQNIPHAKEIVSLLMLQAGTPITTLFNSELQARLTEKFGQLLVPGEAALNFYTQFSNPAKIFYSWNRSLIDARTHFTSGDSAYYLGFASEYRVLKNMNPNLNFGVSLVPQSRVSSKSLTFGRVRGVAISRGAKNLVAAYTIASKLISHDSLNSLSQILFLPPARRDLLALKPTDAVLPVFYDAALQAKGWLDPDARATDVIFRDAIDSITSGRARTYEALKKANDEINALIK